jgi:hypothetical protein
MVIYFVTNSGELRRMKLEQLVKTEQLRCPKCGRFLRIERHQPIFGAEYSLIVGWSSYGYCEHCCMGKVRVEFSESYKK